MGAFINWLLRQHQPTEDPYFIDEQRNPRPELPTPRNTTGPLAYLRAISNPEMSPLKDVIPNEEVPWNDPRAARNAVGSFIKGLTTPGGLLTTASPELGMVQSLGDVGEAIKEGSPFLGAVSAAGILAGTRGFGKKVRSIKTPTPLPNVTGGFKQYHGPIGPSKPLPTHQFDDMINAIEAATVEGKLKGQEFEGLRPLGIQGVLDYNKNPNASPEFARLKAYLDDKLDQVRAAGTVVDYKENYLPQLWEDPAKAKQMLKDFYRIAGLQPGFTLKSTLKNYEAGIAMGLKPKIDNLPDLVSWYETAANKNIATRKYVNYLMENNLLHSPLDVQSRQGLKEISGLPVEVRPFGKDKTYTGTYLVDKGEAEKINSYFGDATDNPLGRGLKTLAGVSTATKNVGLMGGFRGVNYYGMTKALTSGMVKSNPAKAVAETTKTIWDLAQPIAKVDAKLKAVEKELPEFIKGGLSIDIEDYKLFQNKTPDTVLKKTEKFFMEPVIKNMMLKKVNYVKEQIPELMKTGMTRESAIKELSKQANELFGGINTRELGRDPNVQNALRSALLAPDLVEGTARTGKRLAGSVLDINNPKNRAYRNIMVNLLSMYAAGNGINYAINGTSIHGNKTNKMGIELGKDSKGKTISVPLFLGMDAVRLPAEIFSAIAADGDFSGAQKIVASRLGIPIKMAHNLFWSGEDDLGRSLYKDDRTGRPLEGDKVAANVLSEIIDPVTPPVIDAAANAIGQVAAPDAMKRYKIGNVSPEQGIAGSLELPLRFRKEPNVSGGSGGRRAKRRAR